MADLRSVRCLAMAAAAALGVCHAHAQTGDPAAGDSFSGGFKLHRGTSSPVGFNIARAEYRLPCGITTLHCRSTDLAAQHPRPWSLELGLHDLGRSATMPWQTGHTQALSLSVLGRKPVFGFRQLNVYGRVGTTYGFTDLQSAQPVASADSAVGLSYGAGLSMDFTPRLSATLGWDSHDFRVSSGLRDVRSTSIGLQYRY